jgi:hypothetical protein
MLLISVIEAETIVRLEGLDQLKNPMTSSGIEPSAFWLVAQCLNQLRVSIVLFVKSVK